MTEIDIQRFAEFTKAFVGCELSHLWHGYGSTVFFEFGELSARTRRDGTAGNPKGEWTLSATWGWRVEGRRQVWAGSSSEEERWQRILPKLKGTTVLSCEMFGRLGEIRVAFSNGLSFLSFVTHEGDPDWSFGNRENVYLQVTAGRLVLDERDAVRRKADA